MRKFQKRLARRRKQVTPIKQRSAIIPNGLIRGYIKVRSWFEFLEKDPIIKVFVACLVVFTLLQIMVDLSDRVDERNSRSEERISRAWSLLVTPITSDELKKRQLEILFDAGESFSGVDLSCATLNRGWSVEELTCARPLDLTDVKLTNVSTQTFSIEPRTDFFEFMAKPPAYPKWRTDGFCLSDDLGLHFMLPSGVISSENSWKKQDWRTEKRVLLKASGPDFRNSKLSGIDFSGSILSGADFTGSDLRGTVFNDAIIEGGVFRDARFAGLQARNAVFTGSVFSGSRDLDYGLNGLKTASFLGVNLDFAVFDLHNYRNIFEVEKSSVRNAEIYISDQLNALPAEHRLTARETHLMAAELREGTTIEVDSEQPRLKRPNGSYWRSGFIGSDLTCSVFHQSRFLDLSGSNISSVRFPDRQPKSEIAGLMCRGNAHGGRCPSAGIPYVSGALPFDDIWEPQSQDVWAWQNSPPKGRLLGEQVVYCDHEGNTDPDFFSVFRVINRLRILLKSSLIKNTNLNNATDSS